MDSKDKHNRNKNTSPKVVKMKVTYTRPLFKMYGRKPRVIVINAKKLGMLAVCLATAVIVAFLINSSKTPEPIVNESIVNESIVNDNKPSTEVASNDDLLSRSPSYDRPESEQLPKEDEETDEAKEKSIIDLSGRAMEIKSSVSRINEPTPFGEEIIYSGGNAPTIDEPIFKQLFIYNTNTGEEKVVAETQIKFGEIYEGRLNKDWVVWLDTNQTGTNDLYVLNRNTNEISKIKSCNLNKPKLQLWGDNLVWVEQIDAEQDRLYLYNFKSGEPISLESFNNPTYGTCPPAICNDVLVWVCAGDDENQNTSVIKKLDLKKALSIPTGNDHPSSDGDLGQAAYEEGIDPEIIDPQGFAIYPATNGKVIAWLDNLDPSQANLKMTADNGKTIVNIAYGVARPFGVGDDFVVYMQNDSIMVYFWETERYAQLTALGEKGRLSESGVHGNTVVWYDANDNNRAEDIVKVSIIDKTLLDDLE